MSAHALGSPVLFTSSRTTPCLSSRCRHASVALFEAKRDASYTVQKALDDLDAARKNRDAAAGVFVMARSHASDLFTRFARYGNNVIVTWDNQDSATDAYLHAALLLGMALVTRTRTAGEAGDIAALRDIESRIETELGRLAKMENHGDAIGKSVNAWARRRSTCC